jgi:hypothetical protein
VNLVTDEEDRMFLSQPDYSTTYTEAMEQTVIAMLRAHPADLNFLIQAGRSLQRFKNCLRGLSTVQTLTRRTQSGGQGHANERFKVAAESP